MLHECNILNKHDFQEINLSLSVVREILYRDFVSKSTTWFWTL